MRTGMLLQGAGRWAGRHAYKYKTYIGEMKNVPDDRTSPGKCPKEVNLKGFLTISRTSVGRPAEGGSGLPSVPLKIFLLPNVQMLIPKDLIQGRALRC